MFEAFLFIVATAFEFPSTLLVSKKNLNYVAQNLYSKDDDYSEQL